MVAGWETSAKPSTASLRLTDCTPCGKLLMRTGIRSATARALGVNQGRASRDGSGRLVAGIGYEEWLIIGPSGVTLPALATDGSDEQVVAPPYEPGERREVELARDLHVVLDRLGERQRAPEVVEAGREHADAPGAVAVEAVVEPRGDALEIRLERFPLGAGQLALALVELPLGCGEDRVHPRLDRSGRRGLARIEVDVQADRAPVLGAKPCEFTELVPAERPCHDLPLLARGGRF